MKTPQEEATHSPTECCNYSAPLRLPYPVMWNEFNKFVQCHNCGQVWNPKCPELIAVARTAAKSQINAAIFGDEDVELQNALQALRATRKVEL